ncbi:MAG: hypothetical protein GYB65_15345 [Chloroflexi bacterium]|nr:hypothetical protein [Chloroflexota bacterium]
MSIQQDLMHLSRNTMLLCNTASLTVETLPNEPIFIVNLYDGFDTPEAFDTSPQPATSILNTLRTPAAWIIVLHPTLDMEAVINLSSMLTVENKQIFRHPNLLKVTMVAEEPAVHASVQQLDNAAFSCLALAVLNAVAHAVHVGGMN